MTGMGTFRTTALLHCPAHPLAERNIIIKDSKNCHATLGGPDSSLAIRETPQSRQISCTPSLPGVDEVSP
jgi:hypothetical protein